MAQNEMQWSSATPGLLVILVDQSGSMMKEYVDGDSRTEFSAKVINRVINTIIKKNFNKDKPKNRCFISVIGYGYEVKELCSGFLEDLYNNPIRVENRTQMVSDGNGGLVDVTVSRLFWVESIDRSIEGDSLHHFLLDSITMIRDLIFERRNLPSIVLDAGCNFAKLNIEAKSYFTNSIVFGLVDNADAVVCRNKSYNSFRNNGKQYRSGELGGLLETGIGTIQNFRSFIDMIRHD